jgi:hypothetical protein
VLQQYISTGYYVNDCANGVQQPVTGSAVFTGFLDQCDSDGKAYYLAIQSALILRSANPCNPPASGTTTTTTTTTVTTLPPILPGGNYFTYDWTGDFAGENDEYYDIVAWGATNGYLSGNQYKTNQYFSSLSACDLGGYGTVLAVLKGSGSVTGFGYNGTNLLNIPTGLTGIVQISVGYDHCLALNKNGTVTGWGRDNYGVLAFNSGRKNIVKVCAGQGSSVFLTNSGFITGTTFIGGSQMIYPTGSGYKNIDHFSLHILSINSGNVLTGFGINVYGETNTKNLSGISKICAGVGTSMITYNSGYISGYGTTQATYFTPQIFNSGVDAQIRNRIGGVLKQDQNVQQWINPYTAESGNIVQPSYLNNNIVAMFQASHFAAVIFKRGHSFTGSSPTGSDYLWQITGINGGATNIYSNLSVGDLYPSSGQVTIACNGYSFYLPLATGIGFSYSTPFNGCLSPGSTIHVSNNIGFLSLLPKRLLNINYTRTGFSPMTGISATGITTGDFWNNILDTDVNNKTLYYSNGSLSPVSGGYIMIGTGSGGRFNSSDNMFRTYISGISGNIYVKFNNLPTGHYDALVYGHGPSTNFISTIYTSLNGSLISVSGENTGSLWNTYPPFTEGLQFIKVNSGFNINSTGDYLMFCVSGCLNGIQLMQYLQ